MYQLYYKIKIKLELIRSKTLQLMRKKHVLQIVKEHVNQYKIVKKYLH
jgi:hypothetical protein